eukprot:TRINITY_DN1567_c0_g1_i4.p1 TRINITY_DN1567_c0_g1~~TRINITY_DN1567_c0_g1_i4.p1  ORF type:complete len:611 (-),score=50.71 TRINITY_DN1567_c0_g1_i4:110-1942(-)
MGCTLCHFVAPFFSRLFAEAPVRCRKLGKCSVFILLLGQCLPTVLVRWDSTCYWLGHPVPLYQMSLVFLMTVVMTWIAGAFVILMLARSNYYSPESRLHSCAACYAVAMFATQFFSPFSAAVTCTSDATFLNIFFWCDLAWRVGFVTSYSLLFRLCYLKVQLMQAASPVLARASGAFAIACSIFLALRMILYFWSRNISVSKEGEWGILVCAGGLILGYFSLSGALFVVMELSARSALEESAQRDVDVVTASKLKRAARWTRFGARLTLMSLLSSTLVTSWYLFVTTTSSFVWLFTYGCLSFLDSVFNVTAAAILSGFAFPEFMTVEAWSYVQFAASSVEATRRRQIEKRLKDSIGASSGSALTVAVFMEGIPAEKILAVSLGRFRCISWEVLAQRPEIIIDGSPIDGVGLAEPNLYSLSRPCRPGHCDAFYSHSWHDAGKFKWEALKVWCSDFERSHGRQPCLWLDKVCVDQTNIELDLQSLPVFLAGCNTLFATSGSTYRSRLWCTMELLVYRVMLVADPTRSSPQVWLLGEDEQACESQRREWRNFDVRDTKCFHAQDKERFLRVVSQYPGGAEGFNAFIRDLADDFDTFFPGKPRATDWYNFTERV